MRNCIRCVVVVQPICDICLLLQVFLMIAGYRERIADLERELAGKHPTPELLPMAAD